MKKHNKHKRPENKSFRSISKKANSINNMRGVGDLIECLRKELLPQKDKGGNRV